MSGSDASQEAMNPARWRPTIPAEPPRRAPWPCDMGLKDAEDIAATNEDAQAMNSYNARVHAAVDSLLADAARAAVAFVAACVVLGPLFSALEQHL